MRAPARTLSLTVARCTLFPAALLAPRPRKMSSTASSPSHAPPPMVRLADYRLPAYTTKTMELTLSLRPAVSRVTARMRIERRAGAPAAARTLELDRGAPAIVSLVSIAVDGVALAPSEYVLSAAALTLTPAADAFDLEVVTDVRPEMNAALEGLYISDGLYVTQCEATGFRNITFAQDRPDVLAVYTVTVEAPLAFPVLLSNGDRVAAGIVPGEPDRHFARFVDAQPKPTYLFAAIAGDLAKTASTFVTASGKVVDLAIYAAAHDIGKTAWAMESLKRAFRWEETAFGFEYKAKTYSIVAVSNFSMGALSRVSRRLHEVISVLAPWLYLINIKAST